MNELLPALDLLTHDAIAVLIAMPALVLLTHLGVAAILHITTRILKLSAFEGVSAQDRSAFRRGVQRRALW